MDKYVVEKLFEIETIHSKELLDEFLTSLDNIYLATALWYKEVRKLTTNKMIFESINESQIAITIQNLMYIHEIDFKEMILILNFLSTDIWWKNLPSAYSLIKTQKPDKDGITLIHKIQSAYERKMSKQIEKILIDKREETTISRRFI